MLVVLLRRSRACVTFTCIESPHSTRQPRSFTDAPYIDEFVLFVELDLEQTVYPCMCDAALQHLRRKLQSAAVEGLVFVGLCFALVFFVFFVFFFFLLLL